MTHITKPIRKYSTAYCEYPSRILEYSPSILVRILRIHCVSLRMRSRIRRVSCVFSRISRVFTAYSDISGYIRIRIYPDTYPDIILSGYISYPDISGYIRISSRILAYSLFSAYSSAYSRVFIRVFSRIHSLFLRILEYSPRIPAYPPRTRVRVQLYESSRLPVVCETERATRS